MYIFALTQTHRLAWCCKRSYQCIYTQMCVYMHTHTLTLALLIGMMLQKIVSIQIYTNMYSYMNVHTYTHTRSHTHTQTRTQTHIRWVWCWKRSIRSKFLRCPPTRYSLRCVYIHMYGEISLKSQCEYIYGVGGWVAAILIRKRRDRRPATHCYTQQRTGSVEVRLMRKRRDQHTATHCNTLVCYHPPMGVWRHAWCARRERRKSQRDGARERERDLFCPRFRDVCVRSASKCVQECIYVWWCIWYHRSQDGCVCVIYVYVWCTFLDMCACALCEW